MRRASIFLSTLVSVLAAPGPRLDSDSESNPINLHNALLQNQSKSKSEEASNSESKSIKQNLKSSSKSILSSQQRQALLKKNPLFGEVDALKKTLITALNNVEDTIVQTTKPAVDTAVGAVTGPDRHEVEIFKRLDTLEREVRTEARVLTSIERELSRQRKNSIVAVRSLSVGLAGQSSDSEGNVALKKSEAEQSHKESHHKKHHKKSKKKHNDKSKQTLLQKNQATIVSSVSDSVSTESQKLSSINTDKSNANDTVNSTLPVTNLNNVNATQNSSVISNSSMDTNSSSNTSQPLVLSSDSVKTMANSTVNSSVNSTLKQNNSRSDSELTIVEMIQKKNKITDPNDVNNIKIHRKKGSFVTKTMILKQKRRKDHEALKLKYQKQEEEMRKKHQQKKRITDLKGIDMYETNPDQIDFSQIKGEDMDKFFQQHITGFDIDQLNDADDPSKNLSMLPFR